MFSAKGKDIATAMSRINKVTGGGSSNEFVFAEVVKGSVWFSNAYDSKAVRVRVDAEAEKPARFGISRLMLEAAVAKRGILKFIPTEGNLQFAAREGNYKGSVLTVPYQPVSIVTKEVKAAAMQENAAIRKLFGTLVSWAAINCVDGQTALNLCVRDHDGRMSAAVSDQIHFAFVESAEPGNMEMDLPLGSALDISKLLESDKQYSMALHENKMFTWNPDIEIVMPTVAEVSYSFEATAAVVAQMVPTCIIEFKPEDMANALGNLASIQEEGQEVEVSVVDSGKGSLMMRLHSKTGYGQIADGFQVAFISGNAPAKLRVNMALLQDAARMSTGLLTAQFGFFGEKMFGVLAADTKANVSAKYLCAAAIRRQAAQQQAA